MAPKYLQTTYPFKGEDPAATGYAQQNIESPPVTPRHHMSRALTHAVNDYKATQCFRHLNYRGLLPTRRDESRKHPTWTI